MSSAAGASLQGALTPERSSSGPLQVRRTLVAKRLMDLTLGSVLAVLALPVILGLMLLMAWSLRAWPLFVQRRIGRYGREFWFPKIRTLPKTISEYTSKYDFRDDHIPRLGAFLRRSHLDELPQLLLVPVGTMSLVGPRPKMPDVFEPVDLEYQEARTGVRPGLTGLWQVSAHVGRMPHEHPEYDFFYLRHGSLSLDLWILWRTSLVCLLWRPGVTCGQVPRWVRGSGLVAWTPSPLVQFEDGETDDEEVDLTSPAVEGAQV